MSESATQQQQTQDQRLRSITLSEGVFLATIPLVAYLLIFTFRSGYFSVFGLPVQFIQFDIVEVFIVIGILLGWGYAVYLVVYFFSPIFLRAKIPPLIVRIISIWSPIYLSFLFMVAMFNSLWREWLPWGISALLLLVSDFILPMITQRGRKNYLTKLAKSEESLYRIDRGATLNDRIFEFVGRNNVRLALYCALALFMTYQAGRASAMQQVNFHVVDTTPETVVLFLTRDKAIVAPFSRTTKQIETGFSVIELGQDPRLVLHSEKIGPLRLKTSLPTSP